MRSGSLLLCTILLGIFIGCSNSSGPIQNPVDQLQPVIHGAVSSDNRTIWGLWRINISADRNSVTVTPDRTGALHLNATRLLEVTPCTTCLTIENVLILPGEILEANFRLSHPYSGNFNLTGFDVRGIFISGADYDFPVTGRSIAYGDTTLRMITTDGYTSLFNPTEYPETTPPALGYIPGLKATGGDLSSTLNPFLTFEADKPRCTFLPGTTSTRKVQLQLVGGPLDFGYAVDVCWQLVDEPVIDPVEDFPPDANCLEAFRIVPQMLEVIHAYSGSSAEVQVEVFDHQGLDTIASVSIEMPDLFSGEQQLSYSTVSGPNSWLFSGTITNDTDAEAGEYPLLVHVVDTQSDENLGIVDAWQVKEVEVSEMMGWARTWGGFDADAGYSVTAVDEMGNVYLTGAFKDAVDFDPGPGIDPHISMGFRDPYLSKFDSSGTFIWARTWGSQLPEDGTGLTIDPEGMIYNIGYFYEEHTDFDPGEGTDFKASNGGGDCYLSKFDPDGNYLWAKTWGGTSWDLNLGITSDSSGNIYITGTFGSNVVDFDPGPDIDERMVQGPWDIFLTSFDSSGNHRWVQTFGGDFEDSGQGIDIDELGNLFVTGYYNNLVDFDPGPDVDWIVTNGLDDPFLSMYSPDGEYQWTVTWGGFYDDYGYACEVDNLGNVYVTGVYQDIVDFDPGSGINEHTSNGFHDYYLSKFDSSGTHLWVNTWGGSENCLAMEKLIIRGDSLSVDNDGNVLVTGWFCDTVDFDPGPGEVFCTSNGFQDVFLSKFDAQGALLWARNWGGEFAWGDRGYGVSTDSTGRIYVTGLFSGTADFDPGPGTDYHTCEGGYDIFLSMIPPDGNW